MVRSSHFKVDTSEPVELLKTFLFLFARIIRHFSAKGHNKIKPKNVWLYFGFISFLLTKKMVMFFWKIRPKRTEK